MSETEAEVFLASAILETVRSSPTIISSFTNLSISSDKSFVGHAVAIAREVNAGEAVLKGAARQINPVIGRLQKFLDDRQATGHVPEAVG